MTVIIIICYYYPRFAIDFSFSLTTKEFFFYSIFVSALPAFYLCRVNKHRGYQRVSRLKYFALTCFFFLASSPCPFPPFPSLRFLSPHPFPPPFMPSSKLTFQPICITSVSLSCIFSVLYSFLICLFLSSSVLSAPFSPHTGPCPSSLRSSPASPASLLLQP